MSSSRTVRNRQPTQLTLATGCLAVAPAPGPPGATIPGAPAERPPASAGRQRRPGRLRILAPPAGRHRGLAARTPKAALMRGLLAALAVTAMVLVLAPLSTAPVSASTTPKRIAALRWAEHRAGKPYCWGGTGPSCFDCSGLVMKAYRHAGINLPRTTTGMLGSSKLRRIPARDRRRGDLAFYGSGHVELVTGRGTFGALDPGTVVGWHHPNRWWHPTMYFRVR